MQDHAAFGWIDAHLHFDMYAEEERERLFRDAVAAGMEAAVCVSKDLASSQATRAIAGRFGGGVMPAYGYHPEQPVPAPDEEEALFDWIGRCHLAGERFAIGEVGLPYYTRTEAQARGESFDETGHLRLLERFVARAAAWDRPIVLHAVYEDAAKACDLLDRHGVRRAHFHWFKGPAETVERMAAAGRFVSVTPDVAYEPEIRALVDRYPMELLMTETDGPWPHEGPYAGRPTVPAMARDVVLRIAELKGLGAEETAAALLRNARTFYGLDPAARGGA